MAIDRRSSRLGMLGVVALLLVGALGTRLWFLQGVQAQDFQSAVDKAKQRTVYLPPERGRIFDTEGRIVADNKRVLTVTVEWSVIRNKPRARTALFERLSGPLEIPVADMEARYNGTLLKDGTYAGTKYDPLLPLPLKEAVDESTVQFLLERSEDYPGVGVHEEWTRVYPYAPIASHVVGYMGAITKETSEYYENLGYKLNERVGAFGVEQSMEAELHGTWGFQVWEIDAAGNAVRLLREQDPSAGKDIQLSLDLDVQQYAEQALETQLKRRRDLPATAEPYSGIETQPGNPIDKDTEERLDPALGETVPYKAPAGSVVVLDDSNGQVIAMASYPTFDNRWFNAGISKTKFDQLFPESEDPDDSILVNRAIQGRYNIGSTIKPFIAWSAMHSGLIKASDIFMDSGTWKLATVSDEICASGVRCEFKNANDPFGRPSQYGPVDLEDALAVSSDAFFYRLGEQFFGLPDENTLKQDLSMFGFGQDSGIQLPYEWDGRIPDDAIKKQLVDAGVLRKDEAKRLVTGDLVQVAIGQGLMATTPLQLANAYATIANNGFLMVPHIVKNVYAPLTPNKGVMTADLAQGTVVTSYEGPEIKQQLEMPAEQRKPIIDGLTRVILGRGVEYPEGRYRSTTGERLFKTYPYEELPIAGKTGTAQGRNNFPWNDSSAFGAFSLKADMPYTVVAYLEKSGFGAKGAAPVVKCIFTALANPSMMDLVLPSDTLDLRSPLPAESRKLADPGCLEGNDASVTD